MPCRPSGGNTFVPCNTVCWHATQPVDFQRLWEGTYVRHVTLSVGMQQKSVDFQTYTGRHTPVQAFSGDPAMEAPSRVAEECKAKITAFQELLPLISAICNQGLHERHWEKIATVAGFDVRPDEVTSLRRLLDYNIQDHVKVSPPAKSLTSPS